MLTLLKQRLIQLCTFFRAGLLLALALFLTNAALASGLQIRPISISLGSNQKATVVWLENTDDRPIHAQVRVKKWAQGPGGKDQLSATQALVVSPPIMELSPGAKQLIRVIRRSPAPAKQEATYRLFIDQLPSRNPDAGLNFVLSYSVPVFIEPNTNKAATHHLAWSIVDTPDGATLVAKNLGNAHAQVQEINVHPRTEPAFSVKKGLGYVLADSEQHWPLLPQQAQALTDGATLHLKVNYKDVAPFAISRSAR